ncbi:MAG: hypothetical protein WD767_17355 [Alphaproteobacteria bacterium]
MRLLQALVVFMAILIFIAMGFLVYGLMTRPDPAEDAVSGYPPIAGQGFGVTESYLPAGASIAGVEVAEGRIVVRVQLAGGGEEIRVFDLAGGAALGTVRLVPAP